VGNGESRNEAFPSAARSIIDGVSFLSAPESGISKSRRRRLSHPRC
jgi:hypothetical protein